MLLTWVRLIVLVAAILEQLQTDDTDAVNEPPDDDNDENELCKVVEKYGKTKKERKQHEVVRNAKTAKQQFNEMKNNKTYLEVINQRVKAVLDAINFNNGTLINNPSANSSSANMRSTDSAEDPIGLMKPSFILGAFNPAKWMNRIRDDRRLIDMTLPGTHDTMARFDKHTLGFAKCQFATLEEQLYSGIRALDIRCRHYENLFAVHHGPVYQNAYFSTNVVQVCIEFLKNNPSETIVLNMQEASDVAAAKNTEGRSFQEEYKHIIGKYDSQYFLDMISIYSNDHMITLGEARGKIVINTGILYAKTDFKYHQGTLVEQNEFEAIGGEKTNFIKDNMWEAYNAPYDEDRFFVNYFSSSKYLPPFNPAVNALLQNPVFESIIKMMNKAGVKRLGILFMDFPNQKLINHAIDANPFML